MKTPKQQMLASLEAFGKLFQLPSPTPDYLEAIQTVLKFHNWDIDQFNNALNALTQDDKYAEISRFGKYPTIHDYLRVDKQIKSAPFYQALSRYMSGSWWEKDTILELATPQQMNAIEISGGLSKLYERANGEMATPIYKLIDIVAQNESEAPSDAIDNSHRIGKPINLAQIIFRK